VYSHPRDPNLSHLKLCNLIYNVLIANTEVLIRFLLASGCFEV